MTRNLNTTCLWSLNFDYHEVKKQNALPCKFQKILKKASFHFQNFVDQKYFRSCGTS